MNYIIKLILTALIALSATACESLFFHPSQQLLYRPEICSASPENYFVETFDNETLHSWLFKTKAAKPKGTIIFMHGNARNISSETMHLLWVLDFGYNLFVFDYRGFGVSTGKTNFQTIVKDGEDILDGFFEIDNLSHDNIILYGQSMGGAAAISTAANSKYADLIKLLIIECTFYSWQSIAKDVASNNFITWAFQYPVYWAYSRNGINSKDYISKSKIADTLIIHSYEDKFINYEHGVKLYELTNGQKELWLDNFSGHAQFNNTIKNRLKLINFIDKKVK